MADATKARKAATDRIKQLGTASKDLSAKLTELENFASDREASLKKLSAAADGLPKTPAKGATVKDVPELGKLMERSRLTAVSLRYEKSRDATVESLSPRGAHRKMLGNLVSMLNIYVEQHTGGKEGEAAGSRRDPKIIHMALKGLRDADAGMDEAHKSLSVGGKLPTISDKTKVSDLRGYSSDASGELKRVRDVGKTIAGFSSDIDRASDQALQAFAIADSERAA